MNRDLVNKPERLEELPSQFTYFASRNDPFFQNRSMKIFDWTDDIETLFAEIPNFNDLIIVSSSNYY